MLEDALLKEKESLEQQIADLLPTIEEFRRLEVKLQHVNALLGTEKPKVAGIGTVNRRTVGVNWAQLCREHGVQASGDSGHRALKRLKPEIHAAVPHDCQI